MKSEIYSPESETAVLSLVIKNTDLAYSVETLRFYMFSSSANQLLFSQITELASKNLYPDASLLTSSLDAAGALAKAGGREYIDYLLKQEFNKANFNEYVNQVISSYKARSLISMTSNFKADEITTENIEDKISTLRSSLDALVENSSATGTIHIADGVKSLYDEIIARTKNPGVRGTPWGIRKIDSVNGGKNEGELWIIAGRPSMGKTAVVCNAILKDGGNANPCLLFSKEMNYSSLVERLVAIDSGVPISDIRLGILTQEKLDKIQTSLQKIRKYPIYIDTTFMVDEYYIENTIKKFKSMYDIKTTYIDYIQLIAERDDNMVHALGRISRMLKLTAEHLKLTSVVLSQLNRDVEHRENKRPMASDLRQSGNLEEDADVIIGLYRDEQYNKESKYKGMLEFNFLKNRNGPVGMVTLDFEPVTNKIKGD
jgi:replicative DNA helicase